MTTASRIGKTWTKPSLGLHPFDGSTDNNIVAGLQLNSSSELQSIEPGTVFIDERPGCPAAEKFKMVITLFQNGVHEIGATMFASADGFDFKNMTAEPLLKGSDSQDVVFWDKRIKPSGAYVYYGRSHLRGGQNVSCASSLGPSAGSVSEPGRSINHFVIGQDVKKWPVSSAAERAQELTILNTDAFDPPCIDLCEFFDHCSVADHLWQPRTMTTVVILARVLTAHADTNAATPLGDAYFLWPMMYNHFGTIYSQGRGNDGLLEARMAVSRDGTHNVSYISRDAWLVRGEGQTRVNHTGVYEGAYDAASNAVVRGICQIGEGTLMFGWGSQYTHGGYVGMPQPPCRGSSAPVSLSSELCSSFSSWRLVLRICHLH